MPIYDIICGKCGFGEEKLFQRSDELNDYACPKCGGWQWFKRPSRFNWGFGKKTIEKQSMVEMGDINGI